MKRLLSKCILVMCVLLLGLKVFVEPTWHAWRQATLNRDLIVAIKGNEASLVSRLLQQGADANARDRPALNSSWWQVLWDRMHNRRQLEEGETALAVAIEGYSDEKPSVLHALIAAGARVNVKDASGITPLEWAIYKHNLPLVKLCLTHGDNPNHKNVFGQIPLIETISNQDTKIARLLLAYGADPNVWDTASGSTSSFLGDWSFRRRSTLICAVSDFLPWSFDIELVRALLARGADVNATDDQGRTALMWALNISPNDDVIVPLLLRHGASVFHKDKHGVTPIQLAYARQRACKNPNGNDAIAVTQIIRLLKQAGVKEKARGVKR